MSSWTKEFLSVDNCIWCLIELSFPWLAHARIEAHYSIHRSKNGLPFFLSSIPSSFRTQEKLGEPLEAWEHIAGNTYYCCMGCFTVVVVSTLSCAILNGVSILESLRLYELLKLFRTDVLVPEPNDGIQMTNSISNLFTVLLPSYWGGMLSELCSF